MWKKVREQMNLETDSFPSNETYPEAQLGKMGKTCMKILSLKDEEFYEGMGKYFVTLCQECGYEKLLLQLGRRIRDFYLNLDNLHDYLKYTFPKMKAPSFFIEAEDEGSLHMQYRTRRRGFHFYVQGQVKELAKMLFTHTKQFENKLDCKLKKQEIVFDTAVFHYELTFQNHGFVEHRKALEERKDTSMPIRAGVFFDMFPFCILYEKDMTIKNMGTALRYCIPQSVGKKLGEFWELMKPLIDFKYEVIESRLNSMFELATIDEIDKLRTTEGGDTSNTSSEDLNIEDLEDLDKTLHIKGQMIFIDEWQLMLFLACPIMKGLNNLIWSGLFINDLSMHDYSRDIMLANAQQDMEAGLAKMQLNKKIALTKSNEDKAASLKKQNDELGYMFLPTQVSVDILQGKPIEDLTQKIERSALLDIEVHGSSEFCAKAKPAEICFFYNNVESVWDHIVKINKCFKLDRKTQYFVTCGAADKNEQPIESIANCALDMLDASKRALIDPGTKKPVKVSIAVGCGLTVTAVSRGSVPKFGVYGVPVTHASLLLDVAPEDSIIIGPTTRSLLPNMFKCKEFKQVEGVGLAHQILDKEDRKPLSIKDIKTLEPLKEPSEASSKKGEEAKKEGENGGKEEAAPAGHGGVATPSGSGEGGGSGGGDEEAPEADGGSGNGGGEGGEEVETGEGEEKAARPVSVTNTAQCCGGLKSGVCTLI